MYSRMAKLGKCFSLDFSEMMKAIVMRVIGLMALDVGYTMVGTWGRWGVRGAWEKEANEIFQTLISPLCVSRRHS
jgi:hypothetical protein